jgi:hypothetical protein
MAEQKFHMPIRQPTPIASLEKSQVILRPDPLWFLTRGIVLGLVFPLVLAALACRALSSSNECSPSSP